MLSLQNFILSNTASVDAVLFGIWFGDNPSLAGTVRVHGIETVHGTAHIGICIFDKRYWGKGLGSTAILAVTKWCFKEYSLRWIEAGTYSQNVASRKSFIKAGYEWITDIPGKYLFEGKPVTINILAAKNPDFS
jgi:ribosomal-protein-alanine N-acetyltransferase